MRHTNMVSRITAAGAPGTGTHGADLILVPESSTDKAEDRGALCSFLPFRAPTASGSLYFLSLLDVLCTTSLQLGLLGHLYESMKDSKNHIVRTHILLQGEGHTP